MQYGYKFLVFIICIKNSCYEDHALEQHVVVTFNTYNNNRMGYPHSISVMIICNNIDLPYYYLIYIVVQSCWYSLLVQHSEL